MGEPLYDDDDPEGDAAARALINRLDRIIQPLKWLGDAIDFMLRHDDIDSARGVIARAMGLLKQADAALEEAANPEGAAAAVDADDLIRRFAIALNGAHQVLAVGPRGNTHLVQQLLKDRALVVEAETHLARRAR